MVARNHLGLLAALVPAIVMVASHSAYAADGVITGQVRNAVTKDRIPDVVITVTSPALQGEQIVVTDAQGNFRVPRLPPGEGYTVRADAAPYKPATRGSIKLKDGSTVRINFELWCTSDALHVGTPPRHHGYDFGKITRIGSQVVPSSLSSLFSRLEWRAAQAEKPATILDRNVTNLSCLSLARIASPIAPVGQKPIFI